MSDIKGVEISDVLGLSQPLTKLIECVSNGVGKIYEPVHVRRIAKAKAAEIEAISGAINNNLNLPVEYNGGQITISAKEAEELMKRTANRVMFQEMQRQQNIETIVDNAYSELEKEKSVSDEPVDKDWISQFFSAVEDVGEKELQDIWGKILAGEIKQPHTYTLRTLDKLRTMNRYDVELFFKISQFIIISKLDYFITNKDILLNKYHISFDDILKLEECGLIKSSPLLCINPIINSTHDILLHNHQRIGIIETTRTDEFKFEYGVYLLTECGKQLYRIANVCPNNEYFIDLICDLRNKDNELIFSVHIIKKIENINGAEKIDYKPENILPDVN